MKCPVDNDTLVLSDRQGIEIDYCPTCRGVWLDRGELDKLIERSSQSEDRSEYSDERRDHDRRERSDYDDDDDHNEHRGHHDKHKKRGSFLEDFFG